jgi:hypothetical protein
MSPSYQSTPCVLSFTTFPFQCTSPSPSTVVKTFCSYVSSDIFDNYTALGCWHRSAGARGYQNSSKVGGSLGVVVDVGQRGIKQCAERVKPGGSSSATSVGLTHGHWRASKQTLTAHTRSLLVLHAADSTQLTEQLDIRQFLSCPVERTVTTLEWLWRRQQPPDFECSYGYIKQTIADRRHGAPVQVTG